MLSKDQVFAINEFISNNSYIELWEVGDKLTEIVSEIVQNDQQKDILNKFLAKNGTRYVYKVEKAIYEMIQKILSNNCAPEEIDTVLA